MKVGDTVKLTDEAKRIFKSGITSDNSTAKIIKIEPRPGSNDLIHLSRVLIAKMQPHPTIDIAWIQLAPSTLSFSKIFKEY